MAETLYKEIRSDKWHEMSVAQLNQQQDMIMKQLNCLRELIPAASQSVYGMHKALEHALETVNSLIDERNK